MSARARLQPCSVLQPCSALTPECALLVGARSACLPASAMILLGVPSRPPMQLQMQQVFSSAMSFALWRCGALKLKVWSRLRRLESSFSMTSTGDNTPPSHHPTLPTLPSMTSTGATAQSSTPTWRTQLPLFMLWVRVVCKTRCGSGRLQLQLRLQQMILST